MRIVCISDTHSMHRQLTIPSGDILIHAGDITSNGEEITIVDFNEWLGELPHPYKIVVAGNHDYGFEEDSSRYEALLTNAIYLNGNGITIADLQIWGSPTSPISPKFGVHGSFVSQRGVTINKHWECIPTNTDILITHCPPFDILDENEVGSKEGCEDLLKAVEERVKPRLHVFGHIHSGYGQTTFKGIQFVNASSVGLGGKWAGNRLTKIVYQVAIRLYLFRLLNSVKLKFRLRNTAKVYLEACNNPIVIDL